MGQLSGPVIGLPTDSLVAVDRPLGVGPQDRKTMVLARDLDTASSEIFDRVICAVVTERELVGL